MNRIILSMLTVVFAVSGVAAQQLKVDRDTDRFTSYEIGSRMAESEPTSGDLFKADIAKRFSRSETGKFKGMGDNPALGANFKHYTSANTGNNGLSEIFTRFVYQTANGDLFFWGTWN